MKEYERTCTIAGSFRCLDHLPARKVVKARTSHVPAPLGWSHACHAAFILHVFEVQTGILLNSCRQGRRAVVSCPCCVSIWGFLKWRTPKIVQMIGHFFFENRWFGVPTPNKKVCMLFLVSTVVSICRMVSSRCGVLRRVQQRSRLKWIELRCTV
jgi:hypothetical protein